MSVVFADQAKLGGPVSANEAELFGRDDWMTWRAEVMEMG